MRVSGVAYAPGSVPAVGGDASARAVHSPDGSYADGVMVMAGGMDYDATDERTCTETKVDGTRCVAFAVGDGTVCIGHRNAAEKRARLEGEAG